MKRLNSEHIKLLHSILLEETGGLNGARDENMFESAANSPFQTFDGIYMYSTSERKAARRGFSLIKNHPFIDGNKRIGVMTMLASLAFLQAFAISALSLSVIKRLSFSIS